MLISGKTTKLPCNNDQHNYCGPALFSARPRINTGNPPATMTLSCLFLTDLQGKSIISRNYRGDVGVNASIDRFQKYLSEVEDEAKTPVFHVDVHGDVAENHDAVGAAGEATFLCWSMEIRLVVGGR